MRIECRCLAGTRQKQTPVAQNKHNTHGIYIHAYTLLQSLACVSAKAVSQSAFGRPFNWWVSFLAHSRSCANVRDRIHTHILTRHGTCACACIRKNRLNYIQNSLRAHAQHLRNKALTLVCRRVGVCVCVCEQRDDANLHVHVLTITRGTLTHRQCDQSDYSFGFRIKILGIRQRV